MSALYAMHYLGAADVGMGVVYVGRGKIVGLDVASGRYFGTYTESDGKVQADVTLTFPEGGPLATGEEVPPGAKIPMTATWPSDFAGGVPRQIKVGNSTVSVSFDKIGDVP